MAQKFEEEKRWKLHGKHWDSGVQELKLSTTCNSCMTLRTVLGFACDLKRNSLARHPKLNAPPFCPVTLLFLSKACLSLAC